MIPDSIKKFIQVFSHLPAIGPRMATRLALYIAGLDKSTIEGIENVIRNLKQLSRCERCFFLKDSNEKICGICKDPARDPSLVAIVEKETDIITLERTKKFKGMYMVLGTLAERGLFDDLEKARLEHLKKRIEKELNGKIRELVVAVNPTAIGDITYQLIVKEFKNHAEKITRLGRGLPTGGEIEFADEATIESALDNRN